MFQPSTGVSTEPVPITDAVPAASVTSAASRQPMEAVADFKVESHVMLWYTTRLDPIWLVVWNIFFPYL